MLANHSRCRSEKMNITSVTYCVLLVITMTLTRCTATSRLSLWIDEAQVQSIVGLTTTLPFNLYIIYKGNVTPYLNDNEFDASLPVLPHEIDTVNLTWEAGDEQFTYWFDNLKSRNKTILYNPLLSIPASGIIPKGPKKICSTSGIILTVMQHQIFQHLMATLLNSNTLTIQCPSRFTEECLNSVLKKCAPKSCELDPCPTSLLLDNLDAILTIMTTIISNSLLSGVLPTVLSLLSLLQC